MNQPILDANGDYLLVPGINSDIYCLQSDSGKELWKDEIGSQIMARPRIWEGDWAVVYIVESTNGRVSQYDLYSGQRYWDYSCADISERICQDAVEAEFAITPSGNNIYYGDIYGRINSLEVANYATETPSTAPSLAPSSSPTSRPTLSSGPTGTSDPIATAGIDETDFLEKLPTATPTSTVEPTEGLEAEEEQQRDETDVVEEIISNDDEAVSAITDQESAQQEESSTNVAIYIGAAVAGLCVLLVPIVIFSLFRRGKKKPTKTSKMVVEIIDDCDSNDLESQDFGCTSGSNDSNLYGDRIEVELKSSGTPPRASPTKQKKRKKRRSLPDTPQTLNTLESIEELPELQEEPCNSGDNSAMVVIGNKDVIEHRSIEAVNLQQKFESVDDTKAVAPGEAGIAAGSNHLELAVGKKNSLAPLNSGRNTDFTKHYSSDVGGSLPPGSPPSSDPLSTSPTQWTWSSLLQMGTSQSTKKTNDWTDKDSSLFRAENDDDSLFTAVSEKAFF